MISSTSGLTKTVDEALRRRSPVCALIAVSEAAQKRPAEAPRATPAWAVRQPKTATPIAQRRDHDARKIASVAAS